MKKIGIDARLFNQTGIGTYIRNFLYWLNRIPSLYSFVIYLPEKVALLNQFSSQFSIRITPVRWHSFAEQTHFLSMLMRDKPDLMHFPYFSFPVLYPGKFIATVHDVTPLQHKTGQASAQNQFAYAIKYLVFQQVFQSQVMRAKRIITPTLAVKKELERTWGISASNKTEVIYEGVDEELLAVTKPKKPLTCLPSDYYLFVGNLYPHKNIEFMLEGFLKLSDHYPLVIAGPDNYFSQKLKNDYRFKLLQKRNKVIQIFEPTVEELAYLYSHAYALVHPSRSEGFGLTLLEAAFFKLPIVSSRIPSTEELFHTQYFSFDPYNLDEFVAVIRRVQEHRPQVQYDKILTKCSFRSMTEKILQVYSSVL